ncbi:MAG: hypothetical protein HN661_14575, partial [Gammaproteobacteria bacterium]|nr:hypothetical protein [Gammaproteobacteria bacterium]
WELIYLSVFAVIAAVIFSSLLAYWLMPNIQWNLGMLIALFSMLMATDAEHDHDKQYIHIHNQ